MYSKMRIYPFIENFCHKAISEGNYESRLQKLRNILDHADYVVIGAGAGPVSYTHLTLPTKA